MLDLRAFHILGSTTRDEGIMIESDANSALRRKAMLDLADEIEEKTVPVPRDLILLRNDRALIVETLRASARGESVYEAYRETVGRVSRSRERGYAAARANLREARSALAMIRETVETLAPSGSVKASEHLDGPTFMHEADALVAGIAALSSAAILPAAKTAEDETIKELAAWLLALEDASMYEPVPVSLVEHGRRYIDAGLNEKHSGDCTNESHSCVVCSTSNAMAKATQILSALTPSSADARAAAIEEAITPEDAWRELLEKDDRTSPEEYPEMALINFEELANFMRRALAQASATKSAPAFKATQNSAESGSAVTPSWAGAGTADGRKA